MAARLCLQNTMTERKEIFKPRKAGGPVKIFTCGPSIYRFPHVGNYRTFLYEDVLQRYLEYLGYPVQRLINFTDVEDKTVEEAVSKGVSLQEITEPVADRFYQDCRLLRIQLPATVSRSTTSVDQAVHLIQRLMDKKIAYRHRGDIFYDPLKFKGFGKLFKLDMSRWPEKKVRFRKDTYTGRRWNRGDFILWMGREGSCGDIVYWKTALGEGRPSWNVQDPAMITKHLGYQVDISCGGIDNLWRHHDYNIAVIEGVSGKTFARYWLHGEHVLIEGKKMSKSRGNIVYVTDIMDRGYQPHHLRFYLIYGHYRKQLDLCNEMLQTARGKVDTYRELVHRLEEECSPVKNADPSAASEIDWIRKDFESAMNDDLDVAGAFEAVHSRVGRLARMKSAKNLRLRDSRRAVKLLRRIDTVLQILPEIHPDGSATTFGEGV
jgi:cysteinyl-tRNA synthetase